MSPCSVLLGEVGTLPSTLGDHVKENSFNSSYPVVVLPRWPAKQKMQEIHFQSLDGEDPLEKEIATYSSTLAWITPWGKDPGGSRRESLHKLWEIKKRNATQERKILNY